jgi:hypothetical protein
VLRPPQTSAPVGPIPMAGLTPMAARPAAAKAAAQVNLARGASWYYLVYCESVYFALRGEAPLCGQHTIHIVDCGLRARTASKSICEVACVFGFRQHH